MRNALNELHFSILLNNGGVLRHGPHAVVAQTEDMAGNLSPASVALPFTVDRNAPTVAVAPITPSPRNAPVDRMTLTASETLAGFDIADLSLTRDGGPNLLTAAQTIVAAGGTSYALEGLRSLTAADGTYVLSVKPGSGVQDVAGNALASAATGSFVVNGLSLPAVQAIVVNDGAAQRSRITSVTVVFDRPVTLDAGAITLAGLNGAGAGMTATVAPVPGDATRFVLSFTGATTVGGSLGDGVYELSVLAARVHDPALAGAAMAADFKTRFHRLFADADGDGDVDNADRFQLRSTANNRAGDVGFKWFFDHDADGDVDNADLFQVRGRSRVTFKGY